MHFHSQTNLDLAHGEIDPVGPQLARFCDFSLQESLNTFISCLCDSKCQLKLLDVSPVSSQSAVDFLQDTIKAHNNRIIQKRQSRKRCRLSHEELVLRGARKHPYLRAGSTSIENRCASLVWPERWKMTLHSITMFKIVDRVVLSLTWLRSKARCNHEWAHLQGKPSISEGLWVWTRRESVDELSSGGTHNIAWPMVTLSKSDFMFRSQWASYIYLLIKAGFRWAMISQESVQAVLWSGEMSSFRSRAQRDFHHTSPVSRAKQRIKDPSSTPLTIDKMF